MGQRAKRTGVGRAAQRLVKSVQDSNRKPAIGIIDDQKLGIKAAHNNAIRAPRALVTQMKPLTLFSQAKRAVRLAARYQRQIPARAPHFAAGHH